VKMAVWAVCLRLVASGARRSPMAPVMGEVSACWSGGLRAALVRFRMEGPVNSEPAVKGVDDPDECDNEQHSHKVSHRNNKQQE